MQTRRPITSQVLLEAYASEWDRHMQDINVRCLNGVNVPRREMPPSMLIEVKIADKRLRDAKLCNAQFQWQDFSGYDFTFADLTSVVFAYCDLRNARLDATRLRSATFFQCQLGGSSFTEVELFQTRFMEGHGKPVNDLPRGVTQSVRKAACGEKSALFDEANWVRERRLADQRAEQRRAHLEAKNQHASRLQRRYQEIMAERPKAKMSDFTSWED